MLLPKSKTYKTPYHFNPTARTNYPPVERLPSLRYLSPLPIHDPSLGDDEYTTPARLGLLEELQDRGRTLKDVFGPNSTDGDK
jgi:hypothetical protein